MLFIDNSKDELQGFDSRMLEHLASCIQLVLAQCDVQVKGPCMEAFKAKIAPEEFDWQTHKTDLMSSRSTVRL